MNLRRSTERLMENYVLGDLSAADVDEIEHVLARDDADAQHLREILEIEHGIKAAMDVPEFSGNVADDVLHRVSRRTQSGLRQNLAPDLASATVEEALGDGRVSRRIVEGRHHTSSFRIWLRAAMIIALIGSGYVFIIRGLFVDDPSIRAPRETIARGPASQQQNKLGRVRYASIERVVDREPILAKARPNDYTSVFSDQVIETSADEGAEVDLTRGSKLVVLPNTRLIIVRGPVHASYLVRLLQGGLRVDTRGKRPLHLASSATYRGQLEGRGEVQLIEDSPLQSSFNSHPSMLVRVSTRGAQFQNGATQLNLVAGDLALMNLNRAVRLSVEDASREVLRPSGAPIAPIGLARPDAPALRIGSRMLSRGDVAAEMLQTYGMSAADLIMRSVVIQRALDSQKLSVTSSRRADALKIVSHDEFFLAQPLRSQSALEEKAFHLAGLFELEKARHRKALRFDARTALATYRAGWNRLARGLKINWHPASDATALTVGLGREAVPVSRAEVWEGLKGFMRGFELSRLVQSIVERECVEGWLRERGETMPELKLPDRSDPQLAAAMRSMMIMEGRTAASVASRNVVRAAVMTSIRQPTQLEVDQYIANLANAPVQVAFDHIAFPFVDELEGDLQRVDIAEGKAAALVAARSAAVRWRSDSPPHTSTSIQRDSYLWPGVPSARMGPRAWWPEVYGEAFTRGLLRVTEGMVSDPIEGAEAWHVLRPRLRRQLSLDNDAAERVARRVIVNQRFQRRLAGILRSQRIERVDVTSILGD